MKKSSILILILIFAVVLSAQVSDFQKMTFDRQLKACEQGEPFSCMRLGDYYYTGRGVQKDVSMAEVYYEQGTALMKSKCEQGDKDQCSYYAGMLQSGKGVERDMGKAFEIYHDLCNQGNQLSCERLYKMNSQGFIPSDHSLLICSEPVYLY